MTDQRIAIAILDSGIDFRRREFAPYVIRSFDMTGEGPEDLNGHGTSVAVIALGYSDNKPIDPNGVVVFNIKIMNKFLELDEIRMLQGLEKACEVGEPFRATIVNMSAGIIKAKKEDCFTCKRIRQLARRNQEKVVFVFSAGNEGINLDETDHLHIPYHCKSIGVTRDNLNWELFEDAVYFAAKADYNQAQSIVIDVMTHNPENNLKENLIALNQSILFVQLGLSALKTGDKERAEACFATARKANRGFIDIDTVHHH